MRRISAITIGFLIFGLSHLPSLGVDRAPIGVPVTNHESDELVLVGTVSKIYPVSAPRSQRRWAVVVTVDSVVSGEFSGATFTFTVHSPARAGLRVNGVYTIKATKVGEGYVVNELDLKEMPERKKSAGMRSGPPRAGVDRVARDGSLIKGPTCYRDVVLTSF